MTLQALSHSRLQRVITKQWSRQPPPTQPAPLILLICQRSFFAPSWRRLQKDHALARGQNTTARGRLRCFGPLVLRNARTILPRKFQPPTSGRFHCLQTSCQYSYSPTYSSGQTAIDIQRRRVPFSHQHHKISSKTVILQKPPKKKQRTAISIIVLDLQVNLVPGKLSLVPSNFRVQYVLMLSEQCCHAGGKRIRVTSNK